MPGLVDGEVWEPAGYDGWVDCMPPEDDTGAAPYAKQNTVRMKIRLKQSRFMKYLDQFFLFRALASSARRRNQSWRSFFSR